MTDSDLRGPSTGGAELRTAAIQAQRLVLAAQTLDARLSGLPEDAPAQAIREAAVLTRAIATQISGLVHELVAQSERLLVVVEGRETA